MFRRKYEFKPDKDRSGALSKLYITRKQRTAFLKWLLVALILTLICVFQDVLLSRLSLFGTGFDMMAAALLLMCILLDPEIGSIFMLAAAVLYAFSGSAPGYYVIALLVVPGVFFAIVRHCYLHSGFGSTLLCTAAALAVYELALFGIGCFFGYTTVDRMSAVLIKTGLSLTAAPILYPIFTAILKIGDKAWND